MGTKNDKKLSVAVKQGNEICSSHALKRGLIQGFVFPADNNVRARRYSRHEDRWKCDNHRAL